MKRDRRKAAGTMTPGTGAGQPPAPTGGLTMAGTGKSYYRTARVPGCGLLPGESA
jgi:hypothetical protein